MHARGETVGLCVLGTAPDCTSPFHRLEGSLNCFQANPIAIDAACYPSQPQAFNGHRDQRLTSPENREGTIERTTGQPEAEETKHTSNRSAELYIDPQYLQLFEAPSQRCTALTYSRPS